MTPVAIVTGANRGLGHETCRQLAARGFVVVATSRGTGGGAAERVLPAELDVASPDSIEQFRARVAAELGPIDALVNNAGVALDGFDERVARETLAVNLFGAIAVTDALLPLVSEDGTVTMVSSGLGELACVSASLRAELEDPGLTRDRLRARMEGFVGSVAAGTHRGDGWPGSAYRVSKLGLNAFTRILAREQAATGRRVNAVCPGWVRTDMGGADATRSVEEGARGIVWTATLPVGGPSGGFFRDGEGIGW